MLRTVSFNHFGKEQKFYFNIKRLEELEHATGKTIADIGGSNMSIGLMTTALAIGLQHEGKKGKQHYQQAVEDFIDNGGSLDNLWKDIVKALILSGIFGKTAAQKLEQQERGEDVQHTDDEEKNVMRAAD